MLEELLGLNKSLGNLLWTGMMVPYTAYQPNDRFRFGTDLIELIIEVEVGRLGSSYLGFSRSKVDAEHTIQGLHSHYGDALDDFLVGAADKLKAERRAAFLSTLDYDAGMMRKLQNFDRAEDTWFRLHGLVHIQGYVRREFTIGGRLPSQKVEAQLKSFPETLGATVAFSRGRLIMCAAGLAAAPDYHFSDFGHSTTVRFFVNGTAWMGTSCEESDFEFVKHLCAARFAPGCTPAEDDWLVALLTKHTDTRSNTAQRGYCRVPSALIPAAFLQRNGYQVVAYRKYGDAGLQFNGHAGGWHKFNKKPVPKACDPRRFPFDGFGLARPKSDTFGQFELLPEEVCRGGTNAKTYFYDAEYRSLQRDDELAATVLSGVNTNVAAWWELQLYSLANRDLRRCASGEDWTQFWTDTGALNFGCELTRVKMAVRTVLAQIAAEAENQSDSSTKAILTKLSKHCEQAGIPSIVQGFTREGKGEEKSTFLKAEAVDCLNLGLRSCSLLPKMKCVTVLSEARKTRDMVVAALMAKYKQADEKVQECLDRIVEEIEHGNVLTALQQEVNVVLNTLDSCS